jgi:Sulfotransferase domain
MVEVFAGKNDAPAWESALRGEPVDWETLFAGYQATVDLPGCLFYRELLEKYPEAKVILTVRDPERWYDSVNQTIYFAHNTFFKRAAILYPRTRDFRRMINRICDRLFQGRFEDRAFAIDAFNRHNEQVRRDVPADRLLDYEISQGWEPLCAFLGVPIAEGKPFPRLNDATEFRARVERATGMLRRVIGYTAVVATALVLIIIGLIVIWLAP